MGDEVTLILETLVSSEKHWKIIRNYVHITGEHMTEYELAEYLTTLLGYNEEGGSSELTRFDPSTTGDVIEESLPQDVTADMFSNELLGFSMYSDVLGLEQADGGLPQKAA